jgi:hypothetical protein
MVLLLRWTAGQAWRLQDPQESWHSSPFSKLILSFCFLVFWAKSPAFSTVEKYPYFTWLPGYLWLPLYPYFLSHLSPLLQEVGLGLTHCTSSHFCVFLCLEFSSNLTTLNGTNMLLLQNIDPQVRLFHRNPDLSTPSQTSHVQSWAPETPPVPVLSSSSSQQIIPLLYPCSNKKLSVILALLFLSQPNYEVKGDTFDSISKIS